MKQLHPRETSHRKRSSGYDGKCSDPQHKQPSKRRAVRKMRVLLTICFIGLGTLCLIRLCSTHIQNNALEKQQIENLHLLSAGETSAPIPSPGIISADTSAAPPETEAPAPVAASSSSPYLSATQMPGNDHPEILPNLQELYQKNNDCIGWLKINSLYRINFAVVQGSNNFYMNHSFDKTENVNGAAFLDETCKIWPRNDNLIIYAHNMKSGEMFGELNQLQYLDKLYADPFVSFDTLYEQGTYVPLAVFVCSVVQADDYFQFYVRNFKTEEAFDRYISRARELSRVALKTDALYGDELLTLVTCYDRANTQRFVVLLRKLRSNETVETVKSAYFQ